MWDNDLSMQACCRNIDCVYLKSYTLHVDIVTNTISLSYVMYIETITYTRQLL